MRKSDDTISRRMAINALESIGSIDTEADKEYARSVFEALPSTQSGSAEKDIRAMCGECDAWNIYKNYLSAQPEHLTDDDFETIKIHLDAYKEKLCNQGRWKEAKEYQRIYDRFMAFASTQVDRPQGEWIGEADGYADGELVYDTWYCSNCGYVVDDDEPPTWNYCPNCGCYNGGRQSD